MLNGILDNDLYKFTMQHAVLTLYPDAFARYEFVNRGGTSFPGGFERSLREAVQGMADLSLDEGEAGFLRETCPYFPPSYIEFLKGYRYLPEEASVSVADGDLSIRVEGPWYRSILWEVPLLALTSELYFRMAGQPPARGSSEKNRRKGRFFRDLNIPFVDFGTRRRYSGSNHDLVVRDLVESAGPVMRGTSNVHLAMKYGIPPVGTQAHEWIQFHAARCGFRDANGAAMDAWLEVFGDYLKIVLTDTFGTADFFRVFDRERAGVFDGIRQDSGEPLEFLEAAIAHYERLGIDPAEKTVAFSDSLDPGKVEEIHRACAGRVKEMYGIGTNLTNDVGVEPLNMVIKMTGCRVDGKSDWQGVIKLSDDRGKHTGDPEIIEQCMRELYGGPLS